MRDSSVGILSPSMPTSSLAMRWTAGLAVRKESGPPSTMKVPCSLLDDLAVDLAAETVVLLEQHEVDVGARLGRTLDLERRAETGDAAADDDDLLHVHPLVVASGATARAPSLRQ